MRVLVAEPIPREGVNLLKRHYYDVQAASHVLSKEELIQAVGDKNALVCANHIIDAEIIKAGRNLKIISKLAVGVDNIDIKFAGERGIKVANAPGVLMEAVAELVFAHMLALARKVVAADRYIRSGQFKKWSFDLMVGVELKGKTLGILGFGSIGQHFVPIAKGFRMKVIYNNQRGELKKYSNDPQVRFCEKDALLKSADFVVLTVPLTDKTKHFVTYRELSIMKSTAFLINMARGPVVKEDDLIRALKEKKIAGAGLDVYEFEPNVSQELLTMPNTVLTPHIGSATEEARANLSLKAAQNVIDVLESRACANIVNNEYLV